MREAPISVYSRHPALRCPGPLLPRTSLTPPAPPPGGSRRRPLLRSRTPAVTIRASSVLTVQQTRILAFPVLRRDFGGQGGASSGLSRFAIVIPNSLRHYCATKLMNSRLPMCKTYTHYITGSLRHWAVWGQSKGEVSPALRVSASYGPSLYEGFLVTMEKGVAL